jgi:putative DNA primase/helicase
MSWGRTKPKGMPPEMWDEDGEDDPVYAVYSDSKKLPEPDTFPVGAMPRGTWQLINEASAAIGCPPEFVGLPMLAVLGSAIGNSRVLKLKDGWEEGTAVYAAVVADPGEKKTPAHKVAIAPATKHQASLRNAYRVAEDEYKRLARAYEVEKRDAAKAGEPAPPPPQPPVMGRSVVEDTTVEALAVVVEGTPRGVMVVRDEIAGWVRSMDQYRAGGKGADRQFWLSAWSNSYVAVDRKSMTEPLILSRPFVSVFGSIQPAMLGELGAGREDGLLDRFVFAYPDPVPSRWTDAEISAGARDAYAKLYGALRQRHMPEDDHGDPEPIRVHLSLTAKTILVESINAHREEMEAIGFPARLKGPWSKLEAYLARLCLILAMARAADSGEAERVEDQDVLRAVVLLDYFKNQARRVYVGLYGENQLDGLAEDLATFLKERGGYWRGQPSEFHAQLESEHKPRRTDELSKMVRAIAARTPALELEYGHEAVERSEGKRTTRRYIALTLRNGVNSVNTEPKASRATDYGGLRAMSDEAEL